MREFKKEYSKITLIFTTEAIGFSINIFNIYWVVIYQLLSLYPYFATFLQYGGCAGYNGKKAKIIFLFKYWVFSKRDLVL